MINNVRMLRDKLFTKDPAVLKQFDHFLSDEPKLILVPNIINRMVSAHNLGLLYIIQRCQMIFNHIKNNIQNLKIQLISKEYFNKSMLKDMEIILPSYGDEQKLFTMLFGENSFIFNSDISTYKYQATDNLFMPMIAISCNDKTFILPNIFQFNDQMMKDFLMDPKKTIQILQNYLNLISLYYSINLILSLRISEIESTEILDLIRFIFTFSPLSICDLTLPINNSTKLGAFGPKNSYLVEMYKHYFGEDLESIKTDIFKLFMEKNIFITHELITNTINLLSNFIVPQKHNLLSYTVVHQNLIPILRRLLKIISKPQMNILELKATLSKIQKTYTQNVSSCK